MDYFSTALLAAAVIGALCGLVGSLVVLRRRTFFAQALTHATFPGAVAAAMLGLSIPLGAFVASIAIVGIMTLIGRVRRQGSQVAAGIVLTAGFALGVLLQALNPSLPVHVDSFLVGSVLTTTGSDIGLATVYRALADLAGEGEADCLQSPDGESLYRACSTTDHHHHLICRHCGLTVEIEADAVETWAKNVAAEHGFTQAAHVVDVFGLCAACTAASATAVAPA